MEDIKITDIDLVHIHSLAVGNCITLSYKSKFQNDSRKLQAYSYASAVVSWLRSKDAIDFNVDIDKGLPHEK